ncbi:peptidoglycan D,D-transpeptidase FtsI family protein [Paenibacillus senegalensis]|uniref:peptidoglycan D,D-transpeptidase FtsI family protein n=1 Tax=Paenibacillus senegalensis TaxID=1465766 RepID=UPI00028A30A9|nr:penicillin-binding transpeptidase domain-containing protein [Paenibacillus senegalensis]
MNSEFDELTNYEQQEENRKKKLSLRLNVYFFATFLLFSVLVVRLAILQFVEGPDLAIVEKNSLNRDITISPIRGNIYDREQSPIASTTSTQSVSYRLEPGHKQEDTIALAYRLETIFAELGDPRQPPLNAEEILLRMDVGYDIHGEETKAPAYLYWPRRIKSNLTKEEIAYLSEHRDELPGLEVAEESTRVYDERRIAVQLVGYLRPYSTAMNMEASYLNKYKEEQSDYLNDEYVGLDGLEFLYQDELRGKNGSKTYPVNGTSQIVGEVQITPPVKGNNLYLSLHNEVQLAAQRAITEHIKMLNTNPLNRTYARGSNARSGYAVAMEVNTGKVVAMASMPDYDPNVWMGTILENKLKEIQYQYTNGTIRERYADVPEDQIGRHPTSLVPLGSTIKPLTVLVGLNEQLITPTTRYYDEGIYYYGRDNNARVPNSDRKAFGWITPARAIEVSSNTFMAEMVGNQLYTKVPNPLDVWHSYMVRFGLGVSTESGLPGELSGDYFYYDTAERLQAQFPLINGSFGQEARYTTLQLAQYAAMLANEGKRYKPLFVDRITTYEGELIKEIEPELLNEETFPDAYWKVLRDGMKSQVGGFEGVTYSFNRKTGTSESQVAGKTVENAIFIGYAPAENPQLAVAVVVPEGGFGAYGAAPIARHIFDAYDQYIGFGSESTP